MNNVILRLTWTKTQDFFDIVPENPDFVTWWIGQCNNLGNNFDYTGDLSILLDLETKLITAVNDVNVFLEQIHFPIIIPLEADLINRDALNTMHKNWISVLRNEPKIDQVLYFKNKKLFEQFHNINIFVHQIEKALDYRCESTTRWRVDNIFKNESPAYGEHNVCLIYQDWGKSSFDKFHNGDDCPDDEELSNWNTIGSDVRICLDNPVNLEFPSEYKQYCATHKIKMCVHRWPLGNIVDYQNNKSIVGNLLYKNFQIPNNNFRFSLQP